MIRKSKKDQQKLIYIVVGILLLALIIPGAMSATNGTGGEGASSPLVDKGNLANVYTQPLTIDQIVGQKKVKDRPNHKSDREGKLDKNLSDMLSKIGPNDKIRVAIWVKDNDVPKVEKPTIQPSLYSQMEQNLNSNAAIITSAIDAKQKPLKNYLNSKKLKILYASPFAPVIFAELTKSDIKKIEDREEVTLLQTDILNQATIDIAVPTIGAPPVWSYVSGGIKVAVVENDGVSFANPYLKTGIYYNPSNLNIGSHATAVAGIIASTNPTYRGVAWQGPAILSANAQTFYDSDLMTASDWAMTHGAMVLSNSWTQYTRGAFSPITYYFDYIDTHGPYYPTIVFGAGNCGTCVGSFNIVGAPALGYNGISVGSFDDMGTFNWLDDVMSSFSSYGNPPTAHGDRQLPLVAGVGSHNSRAITPGLFSTIIRSPWISGVGSGTSYSTPEVSGEASLLMYKAEDLTIWPEAVRAIIMASADHNIEGSSRLSDLDGAGGIDVLSAYKTVNKGYNIGYGYGILRYDGESRWVGPNIEAYQGQKVRIVFTWDSTASGYAGTDVLGQDLDLYVERLSGTTWVPEPRAGYSISYDNNYEIVEFNAPASGTYRSLIYKYRWDDPSAFTYYGYAAYTEDHT